MGNPWDTIRTALDDAREVERALNHHATAMSRLLVGRLRSGDVSIDVLRALKRELQHFDSTRGKWKNPE